MLTEASFEFFVCSWRQPQQACLSQRWRSVSLRLFTPTQRTSECSATSEIQTSSSMQNILTFTYHYWLSFNFSINLSFSFNFAGSQNLSNHFYFIFFLLLSDQFLLLGDLTLFRNQRRLSLKWRLWRKGCGTIKSRSLRSELSLSYSNCTEAEKERVNLWDTTLLHS